MRFVTVAGLVAGLMLCNGPSWAHAFLKTASPGVGSTVAEAPRQVVIDFTEGIEPAFSSITVQDQTGTRVDTGGARLVGGDTHLMVGLKPIGPGTYTVRWHATATDTHKTQGRFRFTVKPATSAAL